MDRPREDLTNFLTPEYLKERPLPQPDPDYTGKVPQYHTGDTSKFVGSLLDLGGIFSPVKGLPPAMAAYKAASPTVQALTHSDLPALVKAFKGIMKTKPYPGADPLPENVFTYMAKEPAKGIEKAGLEGVKKIDDDSAYWMKAWDKRAPKAAEDWHAKRPNPYTDEVYHGTVSQSWDNDPANYPMTDRFYMAKSPDVASLYAQWQPGITGVPLYQSPGKVLPLKVNTKDYHQYDAGGGVWTQHNDKAVAQAKELGKKGVIVRNVIDDPNTVGGNKGTIGKPTDVYIALNPRENPTIKSKFAKFDPKKYDDPNLMTGVAGAAMMPGLIEYLQNGK
jgi:hypothetical protein